MIYPQSITNQIRLPFFQSPLGATQSTSDRWHHQNSSAVTDLRHITSLHKEITCDKVQNTKYLAGGVGGGGGGGGRTGLVGPSTTRFTHWTLRNLCKFCVHNIMLLRSQSSIAGVGCL